MLAFSHKLVQDPFQVWEESSTSRSLFSRARERHVFLFEKMVIFSKKFEAPVQKREKKSDNYLYKGHLPVSLLALPSSRALRWYIASGLHHVYMQY